jgi:hypothetical protein
MVLNSPELGHFQVSHEVFLLSQQVFVVAKGFPSFPRFFFFNFLIIASEMQ